MERNPSELRGGCGLEKTGSPAYAELKVRIHPPPAAIRRTPTRTGTTSAAANNRVPQVRRDVSWCASQDPAIYSHLSENLGESGSPHKSDTRCSGLWTRWQNRFATDSPLEGDGFELPVREHRARGPPPTSARRSNWRRGYSGAPGRFSTTSSMRPNSLASAGDRNLSRSTAAWIASSG